MIQTVRVRTNKNPTAKVYRLEGITEKQAKILAEKLFCENINQTYTINKSIFFNVIEIAYKMGVMNPEVASIIKAARDLKVNLIACDSSKEYLNKAPAFNPLIENIVKKEPTTLLIKERVGKTAVVPIREMEDKELLLLSKDKLFLNLEEMKTIQNYFQKIKRDPTDLELETLAQTWSEHCAHKTFKAKLVVDGKNKMPLIERIKKEAYKHKKNIVSAFVDNSGVMDFYDGLAINGKAETHNAPSAIEPYGGAMTGSGGVFRDIVATGQGAKCLISTDIFCLAPPNTPKNKLPAGTLPPDYILKRVVAAVRDYGNRIGIPSNNGSFHFHEDFRAKPIVLVGSYGILPRNKAEKGKPKIADLAVVIGGKTGRDGIHGATFSSAVMSEKTVKVNATAVQIGNAIEEKRTFDAILEARDKDLIRAVQDLGAGGLSSAIGEMGEKVGVTVHLEKAPLKYQGLSPWEIWVSESQERMLIVLPKKNLKEFVKICKKYNVETTEIGEFDGSKRLQVFYGKEKVGDLEMKFLYGGLPQRVMHATNVKVAPWSRSHLNIPKTKKGWINHLEKILSHGNINSKEPILRMYDHNVQGTNALHPFTGVGMDGPNDAAVIKPILDKPYGLIVSHGLNPAFTMSDPYWGSIWAASEAISNYVAVGGDYKNASLINNYIWPFPDEEWLGKLDRCVDAVCDFMKALKIPVISGKDSLSATYRGSNGFVLHSPPTLCISVFGRIPDAKKTISSDFKKIGSTIVLVGKQDLENEISYIDIKILPKVLEKIYKAIKEGQVLACHDVSEGGPITTIFEMCVGGNCGVKIKVDGKKLLSETAGCFIVEVKNEEIAKKLFKGIPYEILGKTIKDEKLMVENLFTTDIDRLQKAWSRPMMEVFG
ncbi:MAG: AIR synthase-related protein [Candidatus Daviesbacteria bacterium]|nr:AIR synthase-related protein [Candidatus Daviesbacteria bacterium]